MVFAEGVFEEVNLRLGGAQEVSDDDGRWEGGSEGGRGGCEFALGGGSNGQPSESRPGSAAEVRGGASPLTSRASRTSSGFEDKGGGDNGVGVVSARLNVYNKRYACFGKRMASTSESKAGGRCATIVATRLSD